MEFWLFQCYKLLVKNRFITHTIACYHRFRCWYSNSKGPTHEAKIRPSMEHVEIDGHIQFKDLRDHRYHVCQKSGRNKQMNPIKYVKSIIYLILF